MPLTDKAIKNAKPGAKPQRLFDGGGLYLEVSPAGGKWWRFKYRYAGKEKRISLGVYPDVPLAGSKHRETGKWIDGAREKRDSVRQLLASGIDPGEQKKAMKLASAGRAANSFEVVAREWLEKNSVKWSPGHCDRILARFERDIFPWCGARPVAEITPPELLVVVRRIEARGAIETAHRALTDCGQVFRFGVATGRAERDPTQDLRGALTPVTESRHHAAITEPGRVGELMRQIYGYEGTLAVQCALRLAPLTFVRPGELRKAEWSQFDLDAAEWRYVVTKTKTPHIVPLSSQAVAILRELHPLTGSGKYVFPSARSRERPMSDNAVLSAMRRMGIAKDEMSGHGFRAMARTILDEELGFPVDIIEHQLAHAVRDPNGRAYNRTTHLPARRKMMQRWGDYLDELKAGADVIPLVRASAAGGA